MNTFILRQNSGTSMSEKKSVSNTKFDLCPVCDRYAPVDFLELTAQDDFSFIICANCEAMSAYEGIYYGDDYN